MDFFLQPIQWLRDHPAAASWIAVGSVILAVLYVGILILIVTRMRTDYFITPPPGTPVKGRPLFIVILRAVRTAVGVGLLVLGAAMLVLPGQGLITIAVAVSLLKFPGKKRLLRALFRNERVERTMNSIRRRAGREPLRIPESGNRS